MNIIAKIGGLFIKKAAPTAKQKMVSAVKAGATIAKPFVVDGLKIAGSVAALYGGALLGIAVVDKTKEGIEAGNGVVKEKAGRLIHMAAAGAKAARNTAAATVGLATGIALKATGVFSKKDEAPAAPVAPVQTAVLEEELV